MTKKYKHYDIIKFLVIVGGIVGLLEAINIIISFYGTGLPILGEYYFIRTFDPLITAIVCIVGAVLTLICGLRPDDPIPFHWLIFLIFAIWLIVFGALLGGVLCLIAFLIGLIDDLS